MEGRFFPQGHSPPSWDLSPSTSEPPPPTASCCLPCLGSLWGFPGSWLPLWGQSLDEGRERRHKAAQTLISQRSTSSSHPCGHTATIPMRSERGKENPNTPLSTQAPTSLYLFIYLGKGPTAQAGNGPIPGDSAGLGNKEPHCAPSRAAPQPGPAAEPREGDLRGGSAGRRRGAEGQPALPDSLPMKGLLCVGNGSG